jgi:hypothetical protein
MKLTFDEKEALLAWAKEGKTFTEISNLLDNKVSRQRVKQICDKNKVSPIELRIEKEKATRNERMTKKWGADWANKEWRQSSLHEAMRLKFRSKKRAAEHSKHGWSLDFSDIDWPKTCPVFGIDLDYFTDVVTENSVSFDRLDSTKGYEKGNVAIISWRANRIKNNGTADEHRQIAEYMDKANNIY